MLTRSGSSPFSAIATMILFGLCVAVSVAEDGPADRWDPTSVEDGAFDLLKAASRVSARADTPMPCSPPLEDAVLPHVGEIAATIREMVRG